jgi:riboflavin biosynthesis pyrimidine reductase
MTPPSSVTRRAQETVKVAGLEPLWELKPRAGARRGGGMPAELRTRYGGPLLIPLHRDRPTVIVNFVATLDGVVALGTGKNAGGGAISGFHDPDRFVMGLLRAAADVLVMGAGTARGGSSSHWTPAHVHPASGDAYAQWRAHMGLAPQPTTVIVTASGDLELGRDGWDDPSVPIVIATTASGAARVQARHLPSHVAVESIASGDRLGSREIADLCASLGARLVLCEGGPHLLGQLVGGDLVDELFLTIAPQLVGRASDGRLGLVEGIELSPDDARWYELVSVKRSVDHLFLRHRRRSERRGTQES